MRNEQIENTNFGSVIIKNIKPVLCDPSCSCRQVETLGDAVYMAAGGVPDPTTDHAHKVAAVALKLRDKVKRFKTPQDTSRKFSVRIGTS